MTKYKYSQFGTFSVAIMLPIFIFILIMLFTSGIKDPAQAVILGFVAVTLLICLLIFYKLTISIDDTYLSFSLGIGLISKKYFLSDIKTCKPVKNSAFYGIGIKKIQNGWLYNVSGLGAIELSFKNKNSVVRIGTNDPEAVSLTVNSLIKNDKYENAPVEKGHSGYFFSIIVILLAIILPAVLILAGSQETVVKTAPGSMTIKGMYGLTINYSDIQQLDTIPVLPNIKRRTNGYAFGNTLKGNFTTSDGSRIKLFIKKGSRPVINIKTKDLDIFLNFREKDKTLELYKQLNSFLNK
jgi:hypothetical protein